MPGAAQRAIMAVDMAHNLGAFVDKGGEVSKTFRDLIEEGRKVTATQYLAALRDAERYAEGMLGIFEQVADAIITPSRQGHRSAGASRRPAIRYFARSGPRRVCRPSICRFWRTRMVFRSAFSWSARLDAMNGCCGPRALS